MPKDKSQNAEANTDMIRIRVTPTMRKSFEDFCAEENISEASAGRLGIFGLIAQAHKKRTGQKLEAPDVNAQNWGTKRS